MNKHQEEEIKRFWESHNIYEKSKRSGKKFYFVDGPPYATGSIHMGTAWNKILKDAYIRFWRMNGFNVWDQPGYDTHGLPIENKVEKESQIKSKSDIEKLGIEKFTQECRKFATKYIDIMNQQFIDLGVWMDWSNPYLTLTNDYIEGAWATFKIAFEKGLLYQGLYPVHVCPHCVDPNSTILVGGGTRKIGELKNCWQHNKVLSMDTKSRELTITKPLGYMEHEENAFTIQTKTGKKLIASADHPFWTPLGWTFLSSLKDGTKVAVYNNVESRLPIITEKGNALIGEKDIMITLQRMETIVQRDFHKFNDLTSYSKIEIKKYVAELKKAGYSYNKIIKEIQNSFKIKISKSWVAKIQKVDTSTRYDSIIKDLEEKELIPVFNKSTKSFILARIAGHIFGDGSITIKNSKNRKFPVLDICFCGKEEDLKDIQKDLENLGFNYSGISTVPTESTINGRVVKGFTTSMRCHSSTLSILLITLGCPVGKKTKTQTSVPEWIMSNKKLTREFLASYFGSELQIISPRRYEKGFECLRLYTTKDRNLEDNGVEFAKQVCVLVNKFGVSTGEIKIERNIVNEVKKSKITISIDCNDDNIIKFTRFLGYEYCKYRKIRASHVLGYLLYKKSLEKRYEKLKDKILLLRNSKIPCSKIAIKLGVPELYVRHVVYGKPKSVRAAKYIITFTDWLRDASKDLKDGLIWDEIENVRYLGKRKVCDIAVENHHNFITNGFLTHNCETAVAYNEIEYTNVADPSVYVKFPVKDQPNTFLLIWTTTPWTLPSNTGIMVKPSADYVKVKISDETLIIAKDLVEDVMKRAGITGYKISGSMKGKKLDGLEYEHPLKDLFKFQEPIKHKVVLSEQFVEMESGTGLVHTAPGFGQEDYKVGIENGLAIVSPIKLNGTFNEECGPFSGIHVKVADRQIADILKERNLLLHEEKVTHEYPLCWRCSSPLLEMSVKQWFFKVTAIRKDLLKENKKVNWYPDWAGQRFENWLNSLGDWPISRQRYWGIPLPIWICECGEVRVIGSSDELPVKPKDLHRPYIDQITLPCKCGSQMKRIPDVLDVWFDSGLASWAPVGYPKNDELFNKMWPADLNIEGPDQIRGWWNSQLITSVITFGKAPFKNILFHGFVLDAHGSKMSKSKGNVTAPEEVISKYGRDTLRLYLLSSAPWDDFYFKWTDVDGVSKTFVVMENSYNYVHTYASTAKKVKALEPEDIWILSRLNNVINVATKEFKEYNIHKAANAITDFMVNDFSRVYIKMIRDRAWPGYTGDDKKAAFYTLDSVVRITSKLLAPLCPFFAEHMHLGLKEKEESVHMCKWPKAQIKMINTQIEKEMEFVKEIVETVNSLRKENNVKIRWPVESVYVESDDEVVKSALITFEKVLKNMSNTKYVSMGITDGYKKGFSKGSVYVSKKVLMGEALLREFLREVQTQRKKNNLNVGDRIVLYLDNENLREYEAEIKNKVGAKEVFFGPVENATSCVQLEEEKINFKIETITQKI